MTRSKFSTFLATVAVVPLAALAVAGCGSSSSDVGASTAPSTSVSGRPGTVDVASSDLGTILVNAQGRTLYLFQKDSGTKSECTGACAAAWPPLRATGTPTVGAGARASLVGTTQRSDGQPQVTYNGHPLYLFSGDTQAGQTAGEGSTAFGGGWYAVSSAGDQVSGPPSTPAASSGYGY
jgi:predicted lipoprotein with Yx(FWY)xxD motif